MARVTNEDQTASGPSIQRWHIEKFPHFDAVFRGLLEHAQDAGTAIPEGVQ